MRCQQPYTVPVCIEDLFVEKWMWERNELSVQRTQSAEYFLWYLPCTLLCAICSCLLITVWPLAKATGHKVSHKTFFFFPIVDISYPCWPGDPGCPELIRQLVVLPAASFGPPFSSSELLFQCCSSLLCHWANFNASYLFVYWFSFLFLFSTLALCFQWALCLAPSHVSF